MTNRAAFQSLLAKFLASSSFCGPYRWSMPAVAPWIRANRNASAPASSMTASGSTTLPFVFDIFLPSGSRMSPDSEIVWNGGFPVSSSPSITIRATQKKMISQPVSRTDVG